MLEQNIYILIGKKIRNTRENQSKTQQEMAEVCDFENSTLSRIEAGRTNLTVKHLYKISQALGVKMKDIVDFD